MVKKQLSGHLDSLLSSIDLFSVGAELKFNKGKSRMHSFFGVLVSMAVLIVVLIYSIQRL